MPEGLGGRLGCADRRGQPPSREERNADDRVRAGDLVRHHRRLTRDASGKEALRAAVLRDAADGTNRGEALRGGTVPQRLRRGGVRFEREEPGVALQGERQRAREIQLEPRGWIRGALRGRGDGWLQRRRANGQEGERDEGRGGEEWVAHLAL